MTTIIDLAYMREVLQDRRPEPRVRGPVPEGGAAILLFTGVRYEREEGFPAGSATTAQVNETPRRKKKS